MKHRIAYVDNTSGSKRIHGYWLYDDIPHHRENLESLLEAEARGLINIVHWRTYE